MLTRMPVANMVVISAEPPNDTNGSGIPVTGSSPTTAPMLMTAWPTTHIGDAGREQRAEPVGRAQRGADAEHARTR